MNEIACDACKRTERECHTTSKAAVIGMTRSCATEFGKDNIRVNAITAGGTASEGLSEIMGGDMAVAEERAKATQLIAAQIYPEDIVATLVHLVIDGGKYFLG